MKHTHSVPPGHVDRASTGCSCCDGKKVAHWCPLHGGCARATRTGRTVATAPSTIGLVWKGSPSPRITCRSLPSIGTCIMVEFSNSSPPTSNRSIHRSFCKARPTADHCNVHGTVHVDLHVGIPAAVQYPGTRSRSSIL